MNFKITCDTLLSALWDILMVRHSIHIPTYHYENMPIQIYWKFYHQKDENLQIKFMIIFIFVLKT